LIVVEQIFFHWKIEGWKLLEEMREGTKKAQVYVFDGLIRSFSQIVEKFSKLRVGLKRFL
jgi:hypothetical protein